MSKFWTGLLMIPILSQAALAEETFVVDAKIDKWQSLKRLDANSVYVLIPDPKTRWQVAPPGQLDYTGDNFYSTETPAGNSLNLRLGSLSVNVIHESPDGNHATESFSFHPGQQNVIIRTGAHESSLWAMCADKMGTYGDNAGVAKLIVEKDDPKNSRIRVELPIKVQQEGASSIWTIGQDGGVKSDIRYTVGAGSGSKKYAASLTVEFRDGTAMNYFATATIGPPLFGVRRGNDITNHPVLPVTKLNEIRRAYPNHDVEASINSVEDHAKNLVSIIKSADAKYRVIKNTEIAKDAVKLYIAK